MPWKELTIDHSFFCASDPHHKKQVFKLHFRSISEVDSSDKNVICHPVTRSSPAREEVEELQGASTCDTWGATCNELWRRGSAPVFSCQDVLQLLALEPGESKESCSRFLAASSSNHVASVEAGPGACLWQRLEAFITGPFTQSEASFRA